MLVPPPGLSQKKKKALYIAENIGLKHSPRPMQTDLHYAFYLRSSKKGLGETARVANQLGSPPLIGKFWIGAPNFVTL